MSNKNGISAIANDVIGDVQKEAEAIILAAENEAKENFEIGKGTSRPNIPCYYFPGKGECRGRKAKNCLRNRSGDEKPSSSNKRRT